MLVISWNKKQHFKITIITREHLDMVIIIVFISRGQENCLLSRKISATQANTFMYRMDDRMYFVVQYLNV